MRGRKRECFGWLLINKFKVYSNLHCHSVDKISLLNNIGLSYFENQDYYADIHFNSCYRIILQRQLLRNVNSRKYTREVARNERIAKKVSCICFKGLGENQSKLVRESSILFWWATSSSKSYINVHLRWQRSGNAKVAAPEGECEHKIATARTETLLSDCNNERLKFMEGPSWIATKAH